MENIYRFLRSEDSAEDVRRWIRDYRRDDPLKVINVNHGIILPRIKAKNGEATTWMGLGGVIDEEKKFVDLSAIENISGKGYVFGGAYPFEESTVESMNETVIYIGPMFNHWGHFLYDFVTRLWYCLDRKDIRFAYVGWGFDEGILHGSYGRFFELLGIDKNQLIDIRKPTRFEKIIIPEQCYLRAQYITPEYRKMLSIICNNIKVDDVDECDKLYFSRESVAKSTGWYREYGEKVIAETFKMNGYKVMDPGKMSLDEQVYYINKCKKFACIASSTGTDTMFMKDNTDRIYIKKGFYMDTDLPQVDILTNANRVTYVDAYFEPYKKYRPGHPVGPHMIGATKEFKAFCKEYGLKMLPESYYLKYKIVAIIWFVLASIRKLGFNILYPLYYRSVRKIIRGEV